MSAAPRGGGGGGLGLGAAVAVIVVLVVLAFAGGGDAGSGEPLDPRSDERDGTSALVTLLDELGVDVAVSDRLPSDETEVAVLLTDTLDGPQTRELEAWVLAGGRLVVADPASSLTPPRSGGFDDTEELAATVGELTCGIPALSGLATDDVNPRDRGVLYRVPPGARACIGGNDQAFVVAEAKGGGTVVSLGGAGTLQNAALAQGENAPVAAALIAPDDGGRVVVLEPVPLVGNEPTLLDLVSPPVRRAVAQLGIAVVLYALWRSRRLGAPVSEPQPVSVAGSELVAAVGSLLDRSGSPQHAAEVLRRDLRRFLADRLGVAPGAQARAIAAVAAERAGADAARITWALEPTPVVDDAQLVALAQTIDAIREEILAHV